MQGPAQINNRIRGQFIARRGSVPPLPQQPVFRQPFSLLSANVAACVQSNRVATNAPQWICLSLHPLSVYRYATNAAEAAQLRCLSMGDVAGAAASTAPSSTADVWVGPRQNLGGFSGVAPVPLYSGRFSAAKARVRFSDGSGFAREIVCDVGGGLTLAYCASHVGVDILLPNDSVVAPPNAFGADVAPLPAVEGVVEDFVIEASMTLTEGAGLNTGQAPRLTVSRDIANGDIEIFKVPAGGATVSLAADLTGLAFDWVTFPTNPAGATGSVGVYRAAIVSEGDTLAVPGTARWLQVTNSSGGTVPMSAIWGLEL